MPTPMRIREGVTASRARGRSRKGASGTRLRRKRIPAKRAKARTGIKAGHKRVIRRLDVTGALEWLLPMVENAYTPLVPRGSARPSAPPMAMSSLRQQSVAVLAPAAPTLWRDTLLEYKRRKSAAISVPSALPLAALAAPVVPGARNWLPLGPSVVLNGQTIGKQPVAGRIAGLAVAPGGAVIYAASANGGVFRSGDGGTTWHSLMDRFDLDPTSFASASLACGAIAIDEQDPNRIYVGTGEGDTYHMFQLRIAHALPAYRGVGVIRSDDAGSTWVPEASSPDLAGQAFFALAVDPTNRENVIGATTNGLYRRGPIPGGQFQWTQLKPGAISSVAVASGGGVTRFFAAQWGDSGTPSTVFYSDTHGATWLPAGTGLPTTGAGRIAIGVQRNNPNLIYALIAASGNGGLFGLYRLDGINNAWSQVASVPDVLPLWQGQSQGDYDLAIAVDPVDGNLVYLGGSYANFDPWPGSVWRCTIVRQAAGYKVGTASSIGTHAHSDVHVLAHTPDDANELWCGCDGGVFLNRDCKGAGEFASQNNGLACLCCNFIGQHPTDPNILFTGLQDNGTARTAAGPIWTHVQGGDGGYCVVNWANPNLVLVFANGTVYRSTTGGTSENAWPKTWNFTWATMTQPIVSAPYNPAHPDDANVVAVGDGQIVYISYDFANSWSAQISIPGSGPDNDAFALAFASPSRLFIGTTQGLVFRADRSGSAWQIVRLDDIAAGPLGLTGLISDIAIDWGDNTLSSAYVAFGGIGDPRRVWRFDGAKWQDRSGSGPNHLLDVEHNALVVDRVAPSNLYVGADIGVWHSADAGLNWSPLENGLPDAPVFDLQIHPTQRLLRAATHGRGLYEISLV